jgi:hypothetical protein
MDRVTAEPAPENDARCYRFTWWMRAIYLLVAAVCLLAATYLIARVSNTGAAEAVLHWIEAVALALSAVYFAAGAFISCVLFDEDSVLVRGVFIASSLPKTAIHWCSPGKSQWLARTVLYTDEPETKKLIIVHCYRFDEEWARWIAGLKRLPS